MLEYVKVYNFLLIEFYWKVVLDKIEDEIDLKILWNVIEIFKEKKEIGIF